MSRVWTPELDAKLIELIRLKRTSFQAAKEMGRSRESVKKRSAAIGVRFERTTKLQLETLGANHRPADERSGEILRAHGWRI